MPIDVLPFSGDTSNIEDIRGIIRTKNGKLLTDSTTTLAGRTDGGVIVATPVTPEGHLEVAIHSPRNPFGSIHVENLTPVFQIDSVYGINTQLLKLTTGLGGSIKEEDSQLVLETNTSVGGNATVQSIKRLRYRPGQGSVARFTAVFSTGINNSFQVVGVGHPEDGLYFGYSGQNFGILHSYAGLREIQTLTLTNGASVAGNTNIILNGANHNVQVTNSSNILRTVYEISTGVYTGWVCEPLNSGVIFLNNGVGNKTLPFLFSGNTTLATGSFVKTRSGQAITEDWYPQSEWNIDKANGSGNSAFNLDPTNGNVYQIGYQYLGYGALTFQVEHAPEGNNPDFITVHSIAYPNNHTKPSLRNPSFPFTASSYSFGSTQNLPLKTASFAGFIEGERKLLGPAFTYTATSTTVTDSNYKALFTVRNKLIFRGKANQSTIHCLGLSAGVKHTQPITLFVIKNGNLNGNPLFRDYSINSISSFDNSSTTVEFDGNNQLLFSFSLGETGQDSFDLSEYGIELQPGESITIAARTSAGTAAYVSVSLNTREDY